MTGLKDCNDDESDDRILPSLYPNSLHRWEDVFPTYLFIEESTMLYNFKFTVSALWASFLIKIEQKAKQKKNMSQSCCVHLIHQNASFQFFLFVIFFLFKIYIKRYDRRNKTHWTTNFCELCALIYISLVSSSPKNQVLYITMDKSCDLLKLDISADDLKKKEKKKKTEKKPHGFPICQQLWDRIFYF